MSDLVVHDGDALSESQLIERLSALLACDGSVRMAVKRLAEDGIEVDVAELKRLRERHGGMYMALAAERSRAQEEAMAQEYREIARLTQRASKTFVADLQETLDSGQIPYELQRQLPQTMQALAKLMQVSTDKLLSITGRPQDGGTGDPLAAAKELIDMGVLVPRERPAAVDSTAEEAP
ncbi:MAG TPA: hypothetical protein VFT50_09410 [Baekduia sp.]|nr:hypothetical protein [Baekduia sp.]